MARRRLPGTRWRLLAHAAPTTCDGMYGDPIDVRSDDADPSVFDELVVDHWIHIEQMDTGTWWMSIAGITHFVHVNRDGRPIRVVTYAAGDYDSPHPGCVYEGGA